MPIRNFFYRTTSVEINGTKYKKGNCITSGIDQLSQDPFFLEISEVFICNSKVLFGVIELKTVDFSAFIYSTEFLIS